MKKYLPSVAVLAGTLAVTLLTVTSDASSGVGGLLAFLVTGAGASAALLLLLVAIVGRGRRPIWPSLALGGAVIPIVVVVSGALLFYPMLTLAEVIVEWGETSSFAIGRSIDPWALALIIELVLLAPLVEEFLKPFGSIMRRPKTRRDAFLFGAAAGIGFAIVETLLYASGGALGVDWLAISVTRMVGVALHPFGAALIAVAVFDRRNVIKAYGIAIAAHASWNGTIAVTIVAFAQEGLNSDNLVWGVAMFGVLTVIGTVILTGLVSLSVAIRDDQPVRFFGVLDRLGERQGIGALAIIATAVAFPFAVAMIAFPSFLAL
jgi:RsiW-degrading membrane proteinase PrsW (M82 family)